MSESLFSKMTHKLILQNSSNMTTDVLFISVVPFNQNQVYRGPPPHDSTEGL